MADTVCLVCGHPTPWRCADCSIEGEDMHVCPTVSCRKAHETTCEYRERPSAPPPPPPSPDDPPQAPEEPYVETPLEALSHAVLGPYLDAQQKAKEACFPKGCVVEERVALVRALIADLTAHEGSYGFRATILDEVADDLASFIRFREEADIYRAHKHSGLPYCSNCHPLPCRGWTAHRRQQRLRTKPRHSDLEEMRRDDVIKECIRLRSILSTHAAFPAAPEWVHEVATVLSAWHYECFGAGKGGWWVWQNKDGSKSLSRKTGEDVWHVTILHPNGAASATETTDLVEASRLLTD